MRDPRLDRLADTLVNYSTCVKPGEKVLINTIGQVSELVKAIIHKVSEAGGIPFVHLTSTDITRALVANGTEEQFKALADFEIYRMKQMDCYIGIRASENLSELSDVPQEKLKLYRQHYLRPLLDVRVPCTRWVVLQYPTPSFAQSANMSTEAFEDFYFDVCLMDYSKMDKAMDALVDLMQRTDQVHIKGPGTDLTFSIKGIPSIKCSGQYNIPDGEVFTAPVKTSVNGVITFNTPSLYSGFTFENVSLTFENGKIVKATANDSEKLNHIFDTDEGARYVGEFAIGLNPYIRQPMNNILFDEKIEGSFHFTPGQAYQEADNGNRSAIHWDMVMIQRPEYGGGEIYFDGVLVRKDGRFVLPELTQLNPENLK